jgi:PadR family transcriptional regulator, regulatory protein PadR
MPGRDDDDTIVERCVWRASRYHPAPVDNADRRRAGPSAATTADDDEPYDPGLSYRCAAKRDPPPFDVLMQICYSIGVSNSDRARTEVLPGTLDLMVLQTLESLGPQHGYAIAARLEQVSSGALQLNMGTLYPALMRLEQRGWLRGKWSTTEANRRARLYAITASGRRQLAREVAAWDRMAAIIHALLHGYARG